MHTWQLAIFLCLTAVNAAFAAVSWRAASGFSALRKQMREARAEIADLNSSVDALTESHKRLRSREGMRDLRARRAAEQEAPRPAHETKAQARARIFGAAAGPEFAQRQLGIERGNVG